MFIFRALTALALCGSLAACVDDASRQQQLTQASKVALESSCLGQTDGRCKFSNAPIRLRQSAVRIQGRSVDFFPMAEPLLFLNAGGQQWKAPTNTLTDGASIPTVFVPVIGNPRSPEFALGSALHDAYCGVGNEEGEVFHSQTWQSVHIMFHDALVAAGTDPARAKVMFAAVWLAGPRWGDPRHDLTGVSNEVLLLALANAIEFLEAEQPTLPAFVVYLERLDSWMILQRITARHRGIATEPENGQNGTYNPVSPGGQ